jgi:hypothetical protein
MRASNKAPESPLLADVSDFEIASLAVMISGLPRESGRPVEYIDDAIRLLMLIREIKQNVSRESVESLHKVLRDHYIPPHQKPQIKGLAIEQEIIGPNPKRYWKEKFKTWLQGFPELAKAIAENHGLPADQVASLKATFERTCVQRRKTSARANASRPRHKKF